MEIARTAASYGAAIATSARVTGFLREGERVVGAHVTDLETGESLAVRASQVINATGVWTDEVQALVGRGRIRVRASKGIHLVVPRDRIISDSGLILRTASSVLFVIPWGRHWIIGTTDTDWELDLAHPAASRTDIDYLLAQVNRVLRHPAHARGRRGVYAGLRPLLSGESDATSTLSREHAVATTAPGLVTIAGGKYTTYRVMAQDAVDLAARSLPGRVPDSVTDRTPLVGAIGYHALHNQRHELAAASGLHVVRIEHLLGRYGSLTEELLAMVADDPASASRSQARRTTCGVEAVYAASHEGALHLDDVLTRRTRISIETFDRGLGAAPHVARLMAPVLGWDEPRIAREVAHYEARVAAERESQLQTTTSARTRHASVLRTSAPASARERDRVAPAALTRPARARCRTSSSSSSSPCSSRSASGSSNGSTRCAPRTRCSPSAAAAAPSSCWSSSPSTDADPAALEFRRVTATGTFRPREEVLQRNRIQRGLQGLDVLTPLDLGDGDDAARAARLGPDDHGTPPVGTHLPRGVVDHHRDPRAQRHAAHVRCAGPRGGRPAARLPPGHRAPRPQMTGRAAPRRAAHGRPPGSGSVGHLPAAPEAPGLDEGSHLSYAAQWHLFALLALIAYGAWWRVAAAAGRRGSRRRDPAGTA
jgi:cytochrome oxidase assembly protein ShyY1